MGKRRSSKSLVIDASVIIKSVLPEKSEDHTQTANNILQAYSDGKLKIILPVFWSFEVGNILIRKLSARNLASKFSILLSGGFEEYKFNEEENLTIAQFSQKYSASFYDASYHLLAKFTDSLFVTADKRYYQKFKTDKNIILLDDLII